MPIYTMLLMGLFVFSFIISGSYFVVQMIDTRKLYIVIPLLINIMCFIVSTQFFSESKLREYNFLKYEKQREVLVNLVIKGELQANEQGVIAIPNNMQNENMAKNGSIYLMRYNVRTGIYFCTDNGLLENSSGYFYIVKGLENSNVTGESVTLLEKYAENCYFVSTN